MKEAETRIIDIDVENIRTILKSVNAINIKKENQVNDIYDFENGKLLDNKGYARIRIVENMLDKKNHYFMTVKKMLSQEKFKVMDEHEIEISDPSEGEEIFKALGLVKKQSIKKYRESYKYKNSLIEIDINDKDFCPFPYIEIETAFENELEDIVKLLGYSMEDTSSKTIYEILNEKSRGL
ncbi:adenylate cyclase class 2 [Clostridium acetobutylicum]|uniref:Adenilate cyclase, class2 (Thermophilic) n=1 Tax=Clostridium acetobutylicum (strain ATCC 824 / DSM 792 / JCM 1419 / IAM 19013 / LMG 5710 / NBRC 13948 / NRRL B-527 / VKM B-1787 / 2291 / W) TaxID=272562 RepID=Q97LB2_CLOAB|nr:MULTISPECIES: class IV adenylate cyclase [Clostridium]AAK78627.1 Adenilate cyclase, class2 (thermophilic) [Clostridium acetobutylicum ATCC 824]ADZ19701.1 Adenilate cyclase, class2 (thermophilic) [Clostridium acetobutylicum EA 2018]AEI31356.1 adenylate cyclase [Clostridium acetobutylicum DSM 1731]AWV80350.1 CYTH domain-containing protein [Clostridium acetobutylicum]MBC2392538.1 class IV adenylate cyclase [Clostridium acetobutylicum]